MQLPIVRGLVGRFHRLLKWSERYTKVDMVYLAKGGGVLSVADIFLALVSLGLSVLIAAYVEKDTYGIYRYILSMAGIFGAFSLTGMNTAVTRAVALGREGTFAKSLPLQGKYAVLQFVAAGMVAGYYFLKGNEIYGFAFAAVALIAPLSNIANTYTAYLNGKKDFTQLAFWRVQSGVVHVVAMIAIVLNSPTVIALTFVYFVSNLVINAWFLYRAFKHYRPNTIYEKEDLTYGKHLSVMNAVGIFASQLDSVLVYHLLGPVALAVYTFATLIPDRLRSLLNVLPTLILPKLVGKSHDELRESAPRRVAMLLGVTFMIAVAYAIAAPFIFSLLFPAYTDAIPYSMVAGLILLSASTKYVSTALTAEGSHKALYTVSLATPIARIVLTVLCIPVLGIWGALIARLGSGVFSGVISYALLQKKHSS